VALYVGVDAPPHFNLHQRLRGPGKLCSLCFAHSWEAVHIAMFMTGAVVKLEPQVLTQEIS